MKAITRRIILSMLTVMMLTSGKTFAQDDFKYIAVHLGNPEFSKVIDQSEYPGFHFYTTKKDEIYRYYEQAPIVSGIGKGNFMPGFYGEIPEKMGFSPNYQIGMPVLVVGSDGVIAGFASGGFYAGLIGDAYDGANIVGNLNKAMRDLKRGKLAKKVPAKNQVYLKSTPIGQLEPVKRAKTDKKKTNLIGWDLPDITVFDDGGNAKSLKALCEGKNCVIIFWSMGGILEKEGSRRDGSIIKEESPNNIPAKSTKEWSPYLTGKAPLDYVFRIVKRGR